jgi:hypothetical protein
MQRTKMDSKDPLMEDYSESDSDDEKEQINTTQQAE